MAVRRALVVDDSRSARAFLTRLLERHELAVDGVESAEQAIDYLTRQRPDVIFMDHLMPGMDGFQAVQTIKNNPLTATIPIMMYTSQEGELYLSQARALGAIGVLPKQTKHTDVSKVLEQLHLTGTAPRLDDSLVDYPEIFAEAQAETIRARGPEVQGAGDSAADPNPEETADIEAPQLHTATAPTGVPGIAAAASAAVQGGGADSGTGTFPVGQDRRGASRPNLPAMPPELRAIVEAMVTHHLRNLQRFISENFEMQADRVVGDVRLMLKDQLPQAAPVLPQTVEPPRSSNGFWTGMLGVLLALLAGWQWYEQRLESAALSAQLEQAQQDLRAMGGSVRPSNLAAPGPAAAVSTAGQAQSDGGADNAIVEPVPFGELPLAGARLERIQALLSRLNAQGFRGQVEIRAIPGRFCMLNGTGATPSLAADVVPFTKCDQVGNPREDNGSVSARQSVAFANMIAAARQAANGKLDVQISSGAPDETVTAYPPASEGLTAGDWNRAAAANNRVEVHWQSTR